MPKHKQTLPPQPDRQAKEIEPLLTMTKRLCIVEAVNVFQF